MILKHFDHVLVDLVALYTAPSHDQRHYKFSFSMLYAKVFDMEGLHKMMFGLGESKNFPWAYTGFQAFGFGFIGSNQNWASPNKNFVMHSVCSILDQITETAKNWPQWRLLCYRVIQMNSCVGNLDSQGAENLRLYSLQRKDYPEYRNFYLVMDFLNLSNY